MQNINSKQILDRFSNRMNIKESSVPLFEVDTNLNVNIHEVGKTRKRLVLSRDRRMEELIINETKKLVSDWELSANQYDGLIYIMSYQDSESNFVPLYIGKTETFGKSERNLSVNIKNLATDQSKFARWGDGYQYHIGDLSAIVLAHAGKEKAGAKYRDWADKMFVDYPIRSTEKPKLKKQVFFWTMAWPKSSTGPWEEFGPTNLTFLEYLLIGIASSAYPETVLNKEGQNRGQVKAQIRLSKP